LTDEVEGYDIDGTVDHESKDEQADRGGTENRRGPQSAVLRLTIAASENTFV
jgi:hypothetical protein